MVNDQTSLDKEQQDLLNQVDNEDFEEETIEEVEETPEETEEVEEEKTEEEEVVQDDDDSDVVEEEDETDQPTGRKPKFVRLERHLKKEAKYKDEIQALKDKLNEKSEGEEDDSALKSFADEAGFDAEQVKKLVEIAEKSASKKMQSEFADKFAQLDTMSTKAKQDSADAEQEKGYATELKELKGNHDGETIDTAKLKKLAFTQKYANLSLEEIVKLEDLSSTRRRTVESSKKSGKKSTDTTYDFDNIIKTNDEEAMAKIMSNPKSKAEFDKFVRRKGI